MRCATQGVHVTESTRKQSRVVTIVGTFLQYGICAETPVAPLDEAQRQLLVVLVSEHADLLGAQSSGSCLRSIRIVRQAKLEPRVTPPQAPEPSVEENRVAVAAMLEGIKDARVLDKLALSCTSRSRRRRQRVRNQRPTAVVEILTSESVRIQFAGRSRRTERASNAHTYDNSPRWSFRLVSIPASHVLGAEATLGAGEFQAITICSTSMKRSLVGIGRL